MAVQAAGAGTSRGRYPDAPVGPQCESHGPPTVCDHAIADGQGLQPRGGPRWRHESTSAVDQIRSGHRDLQGLYQAAFRKSMPSALTGQGWALVKLAGYDARSATADWY
jgi:hypothetical protein